MNNRLFKEVNYDLGKLINQIELGQIGLPDIQRPFVWQNTKVRDLFDSMYRGYPVGYFLFWQNQVERSVKTIGTDAKQKYPDLLIVDGQQRLTSLYAVIKGIPVVRSISQKEKIEIAFNPLSEKFEVADAAIRKDKNYIADISKVWDPAIGLMSLTSLHIAELKKDSELTTDQERVIERSIQRLYNLLYYPFTVLELTSDNTEDQVAEVFVRINSKGKSLNQSDFILTLMSVFWDEGRTDLEAFSREAKTPGLDQPSPFNYIFRPEPEHLVRICVGIGFRRARLHYVYSILRGKNLETGEYDPGRREEQFFILKESQKTALNLMYWHDFLSAVQMAGYRREAMISSQTNVLFAYILYIMGRTEYKTDEFQLKKAIAKWFYMTSLTGRYRVSQESTMESDLSRFRNVTTPQDFIAEMERIAREQLTEDFWSITLPGNLATSSSRSPSLFAYTAALNLLEANALYSSSKMTDLLNPATHTKRKLMERHHLFPVNWLKKQGITDQKDINQIANLAFVDWNDNMSISDSAPEIYVADIESRFSPPELKQMYDWHALPNDWTSMPYQEFLQKRRERIAQLIRAGYEKLGISDVDTQKISIQDIVSGGESDGVEFKSTVKVNLHTGEPDQRIEMAVLKSVAGFLNTRGGRLVIGVSDNGEPTGLDADGFENQDKFYQHVTNLFSDRLGTHLGLYISARFEEYKGSQVMVIETQPARQPVYVKENQNKRFFVRYGNTTRELNGEEMQKYILLRFRT